MIVEDENWRAAEAARERLAKRVDRLERPSEDTNHLNAILWADRESVAARVRNRRPARFMASADAGGSAAPTDARLTGPMVVHEAHAISPRLPQSFRHLTSGERIKLGLAAHEVVVAHDAILRGDLVTSSRTTYWLAPPAAILNMLIVCGDGIPAPAEAALLAAGWRRAGGAAVPRSNHGEAP
jgi:hypothetical protein